MRASAYVAPPSFAALSASMRSSFVAGSIGGGTDVRNAAGVVSALAAASAVRSAPPAAIAPAAMPVFFRNSRRSDIGNWEEGTTQASDQTTTRKDVDANRFRGAGASCSLHGVNDRGA